MNTFQIYDNLIYRLYEVERFEEVKDVVLEALQQLMPYQYASMVQMMQNRSEKNMWKAKNVFGRPQAFAEAEKQSIERNRLEWKRRLGASEETEVYHLEKNSEDISARMEFKNTYCSYGISDALRLVIRSHQKTLAVLTLYRTEKEPAFSGSELLLLKRLGRHLGAICYRFWQTQECGSSAEETVEEIAERVHMTPKEKEILRLIFLARSNYEICDELSIKEHTLQKHFQNIYRKLNISSKWELMRFSVDAAPQMAV